MEKAINHATDCHRGTYHATRTITGRITLSQCAAHLAPSPTGGFVGTVRALRRLLAGIKG